MNSGPRSLKHTISRQQSISSRVRHVRDAQKDPIFNISTNNGIDSVFIGKRNDKKQQRRCSEGDEICRGKKRSKTNRMSDSPLRFWIRHYYWLAVPNSVWEDCLWNVDVFSHSLSLIWTNIDADAPRRRALTWFFVYISFWLGTPVAPIFSHKYTMECVQRA